MLTGTCLMPKIIHSGSKCIEIEDHRDAVKTFVSIALKVDATRTGVANDTGMVLIEPGHDQNKNEVIVYGNSTPYQVVLVGVSHAEWDQIGPQPMTQQ